MVKRYTTGRHLVLEYPTGELVAWSDYAALEARCREQLEALREGAEYLHAFTPAGTPAVDAFIAKWSDRTALETKAECIHKWIGLAQGGFRCTQCDAELEDQL